MPANRPAILPAAHRRTREASHEAVQQTSCGCLAGAGPGWRSQAHKDDIDINRLNNSLNQLSSDPTLGMYAQADQALARNAIAELANASSHDRPHALYMAERRVDQAKAAAQLEDARTRLAQLSREHDQLLLQRSQIDANAAQKELEFQRMQYQMAQEETARLQQQGLEAANQADQARAEAEHARKLAAAQSRVARA
ncbi:hypothetical protein, partial [Rhodanobacter sp. 115]|uniref:hypothetical protein n=1 Tax=Rhodanobacter sp. FW021-MT20 TaxID=1162282 RepID=UPI0012FB8B80